MRINTMGNEVSHYSQVNNYTGVAGADPYQLVQLLLDGALGKIAVAKGFMERGETGRKGEVIGQAISIIGGLRSSLNLSAGGEIAVNLDNIYEYVERQLVQANLKNDVAIIGEVVTLLREIKAAWESIPVNQRSKSEVENQAV